MSMLIVDRRTLLLCTIYLISDAGIAGIGSGGKRRKRTIYTCLLPSGRGGCLVIGLVTLSAVRLVVIL